MNLNDKPVVYPRSVHQISRKHLDPDALRTLYRLMRADFKAYLVGGGVRDLLLGKKPKDFDIATDATPRQIRKLFGNSRVIGRRFKLVHVFFPDGKNIEVATFRDTKDPEVSDDEGISDDNIFGTPATDAHRRDLTINGLFYDIATFSVLDYVGGMDDLKARIVRIIGEPNIRFREDPVRMIRAVRHAARNDFAIEHFTWEAIAANKSLIKQAASARLFDELKKDLTSGHTLKTLRLLSHSELLETWIPEFSAGGTIALNQPTNFTAALARLDELVAAGETVSPVVSIAILVFFAGAFNATTQEIGGLLCKSGEIDKQINRSFPSLQLPRKDKENLQFIFELFAAFITHSPNLLKTPFRAPEDLIDLARQFFTSMGHAEEFDPFLSEIEYIPTKHQPRNPNPRERRGGTHPRRDRRNFRKEQK
jgi:poly(A) polymerase